MSPSARVVFCFPQLEFHNIYLCITDQESMSYTLRVYVALYINHPRVLSVYCDLNNSNLKSSGIPTLLYSYYSWRSTYDLFLILVTQIVPHVT